MKLNTAKRIDNFRNFMFSGKAKFSMYNNISGNRVNFYIRQEEGNPTSWSVIVPLSLKTWIRLWKIDMKECGTLKPVNYESLGDKFRKEEIAISWLIDLLFNNGKWRDDVEMLWGKRCGCCGRPLKTTTAIALGLGSNCAKIPSFLTLEAKRKYYRRKEVTK